MNLRKLSWVALLLVLSMVLVACGGGGDDDEEGENGEAQDADGIELPQEVTASGDNFTLTISIPEDWAAEGDEFGDLNIASSQAILELVNSSDSPDSIEADSVGGGMTVFPVDSLSFLELDETASPADLLDALLNSAEQEGLNLGEIESATVNDREVAIVTGTQTLDESTFDQTTIVIAVEGGFVLGNFLAGEGEIADFDETLRAIAGTATVTFSAMDLEGTEEPAG